MILDVDLAVSLTAYGKLADATFPQALENPPGFPQTHSLDDGISLLTAYRGTDAPSSPLPPCPPRKTLRRAMIVWRKPNPYPAFRLRGALSCGDTGLRDVHAAHSPVCCGR